MLAVDFDVVRGFARSGRTRPQNIIWFERDGQVFLETGYQQIVECLYERCLRLPTQLLQRAGAVEIEKAVTIAEQQFVAIVRAVLS